MDLPRTLTSTQAASASAAAAAEAEAAAFVQTYLPQVYRLALSILNEPAEADEATQDTFIAALKGRQDYRGESSEKTWLFSIAINTCRRRLRRRKAQEGLVRTLQSIFRVTGAGPTHPEETVLRREARTALWAAVSALGEKHRWPIVLYYDHDLSVAEIAQVLDLPAGTVLSRLHTARERLRAALRSSETLLEAYEMLNEAENHETD